MQVCVVAGNISPWKVAISWLFSIGNDMCDTWLIGVDATVEIVSFLQASPFQMIFVPMFVLWMHGQHVEVRMCSACMR